MAENATNNTFINNTLITDGGASDLLYIVAKAGKNKFYLNNFTATTGLYVVDYNGSNYYNGTYDGKNQGNIYPNVINGSVSIYGTVVSSKSGLYIGTSGTGYPYNISTSLGKFSCNFVGCADYAPLTTSSNSPPIVSNVKLNATSIYNYSSDNLTVYFSQSDSDGDTLSNVTDWRKNGQSIAVLNMPFNNNVSVNTSGAVKDYSTYGNNGTLAASTATPLWTSAGKVGGAYVFDGIDDRIVITENIPLNFTQYISYGAWFKANTLSTWAGIMSREPSWGSGYNLQVGTSQNIACGFGVYTISNSAPTAGLWYHAICVYNGTAMRLYVNGVLQNDIDTSPLNVGTGNLMLGVFYTAPSLYFNGTIDEVILFNYTLSPEQIQAIYQAGMNNHSLNTIVRNETSIGENWSSCVTASDGKDDSTTVCSNNVTITNAPPTIISSTILPSPAYRNASLRGYCNATDADNDNVKYYYKWFVNGVFNVSGNTSSVAPAITRNIANISNASLAVGQNWTLECFAEDGTSNSTAMNSSITTIQPRTPEKVTLKQPTNLNYTVHNRKPLFEWYYTNVTTYYEITVTSNNCPTVLGNVTYPTLNFTPSQELCLKSEGYDTYYNWTVRACGTDACGNSSDTWNFTIEPFIDITLTTDSINFGSMTLGEEKDTTSGTPAPFVLRNDGNVMAEMVNISVQQPMWQSVALGTEYFQAKADIAESGSFNTTGSLVNWFNLTANNDSIIKQLNYSDSNDSAQVDIRIKVPPTEPPGTKNAQVLFTWVQTP